MIKVIAFDLDDTLWAVKPVIIRAEQRLDEWFTLHIPELLFDVTSMRDLRHDLISQEPELGKKITELRRRIIERALRLSHIEESRAAELSKVAIEIFLAARNDIELFEGAETAIRALAKGYVLGALTNGNADIKRLGLGHVFDFAFSAEQVGAPKPAPQLFNAALQYTQTAPHEMVYVGDDPLLDIDAANRLGLHTIWVKNSERPGPGESVPDEIIEHLHELPAAVARLQSRN